MSILKMVKNLVDGDGLTFKNCKAVSYKTGWQVATDGVEAVTAEEATNIIQELKTCGVWLSNGIYYVDISHHIKTKKEAMEIGMRNNQQTIYGWAKGNLVCC